MNQDVLPGCSGSWIRILIIYPSRIQSGKDFGSRFRIPIKGFYVFLSHVFKLSEIWSRSSYRIRILISYLSRIQGAKWRRIPDPNPQHWFLSGPSDSTFWTCWRGVQCPHYFNIKKTIFVKAWIPVFKKMHSRFVAESGINMSDP